MLILDLIFDWFGHRTARWLIPILSLGHVKADAFTSNKVGFNWLGFRRDEDGALLCSSTMSAWIGVLFWIAGFAVLILVRDRI